MEEGLTIIDKEKRAEELKKLILQFSKFVAVGLTNTAITLGTIWLFREFFGLGKYISNGAGYLLGFLNSFVLNKIWTFRSRKHPLREFLLFFIIFAISYGIQYTTLRFLENFGLGEWIDTLIGMVVYTLINFAGNRLITFKK